MSRAKFRKRLVILLLIFALLMMGVVQLYSAAVQLNPTIKGMMDLVDPLTVMQYDEELSGERPVLILGNPYTITTRYTYSGEPISKTTRFVGEHLAGLGLDVEYHHWSPIAGDTAPNVIGEITGSINPDEIVLISAHLDSTSNDQLNNAPGADDNASGSTAVLVAADILSQYQWGCTLRFALWTGEEQGLLGSHAYALRASNNSENIKGVLNLDMVAWNTPASSPDIDLHSNSNSLDLAYLFAKVVDVYGLNLIPEIIPQGTNRSDHASFWFFGYPAILGIEDFGDFNPYYHSTQDLSKNLDIGYFTEFVKASVGTLAHLSGCLLPESAGYLEGYVTAVSSGSPIISATVSIDTPSGIVTTTTGVTGYYTRTLPGGVFPVTVTAVDYFSSSLNHVVVLSGNVTNLNFSLTQEFVYYFPLVIFEQ